VKSNFFHSFLNVSRVQNVDQEEDIVWEGESDSESDDVSTEMIEKALAPEELLVVGSTKSN
jgi:phage-related baseplate assembly protein